MMGLFLLIYAIIGSGISLFILYFNVLLEKRLIHARYKTSVKKSLINDAISRILNDNPDFVPFSKKEKIKIFLSTIILWPFVLGYSVRKSFKELIAKIKSI